MVQSYLTSALNEAILLLIATVLRDFSLLLSFEKQVSLMPSVGYVDGGVGGGRG